MRVQEQRQQVLGHEARGRHHGVRLCSCRASGFGGLRRFGRLEGSRDMLQEGESRPVAHGDISMAKGPA